jgi:hypothetical protein
MKVLVPISKKRWGNQNEMSNKIGRNSMFCIKFPKKFVKAGGINEICR